VTGRMPHQNWIEGRSGERDGGSRALSGRCCSVRPRAEKPLPYLSLFLKKHRTKYYELLDGVRRDGDWEAWLSFFLDGVRETSAGAVASAHTMSELFRADRETTGS